MALTEHEEKALEHIRQEQRREAFQRQLQALLKAPAVHARRVKDKFGPLTRTGRID